MKALQAAASRNSNATGLAVEELRSARMQVDGLNLRISELETQNSVLNVSYYKLFISFTFFYRILFFLFKILVFSVVLKFNFLFHRIVAVN